MTCEQIIEKESPSVFMLMAYEDNFINENIVHKF
jgi:hypothetical protein